MKKNPDLTNALLDCWEITNQVSIHLIKTIDPILWDKKIPGYPHKTIGMLMVHLHNARCMWINDIGKEKFKPALARLDPKQAPRKEVLIALKQSSKAMVALLERCLENGGRLPTRPAWLNFPNDVIHLLAYFVAHEAHHRGQIIMASRQFNRPFERADAGELWQWNKRLKESKK
jgi:uncharacterized damage-inducible protein DinB